MMRRVALAAVTLLAGCGVEVVTLEDAVVEVAPYVCDRTEACYPEDFAEKFGTHDTCVAFVLFSCHDGACDGATVDRDVLDDCIDWLESGDCSGTSAACDEAFGQLEDE